MNKILFLIIITPCTLLSNPCSAQFNVYHSFPHTNASWCQTDSVLDNGCWSDSWITSYYDFYVNGDTVVNSKTYFKVRKSGGYESGDACTPSQNNDYDYLAGLLREDTTAKKVYISVAPNWGIDTLLYDFTLTQGEYLPPSYVTGPFDSTYIYSIDSILVGGSYRKQFIIALSKSFNQIVDSIIEGIGSMKGLLEQFYSFGGNLSSRLTGFRNSTVLFPAGDTCKRYFLATENIQIPKANITIYPNPSNGKFTFSYSNPELVSGSQTIAVFNVLGENVYHATLNQVQDDYEINLSAQPNGVYFYRIIAEDESLVGEGKLVIQK